jgi:IS30 family transposase
MKPYKQLSQDQRYQIEILKKAGKNQNEIAGLLEVSPATICRKLKRNTGERGYRPKQAHKLGTDHPKQFYQAKPYRSEVCF